MEVPRGRPGLRLRAQGDRPGLRRQRGLTRPRFFGLSTTGCPDSPFLAAGRAGNRILTIETLIDETPTDKTPTPNALTHGARPTAGSSRHTPRRTGHS